MEGLIVIGLLIAMWVIALVPVEKQLSILLLVILASSSLMMLKKIK